MEDKDVCKKIEQHIKNKASIKWLKNFVDTEIKKNAATIEEAHENKDYIIEAGAMGRKAAFEMVKVVLDDIKID